MISRAGLPIVATIAVLTLAACGRGAGGDAPTESAEGAAGVVASGNAAASQDPASTSLSGGPAGQTPAYGQPGGTAATSVTEQGDAPASVGSENSPAGGESPGADADNKTTPK